LEPLKAVLFANSPFTWGNARYLCARDMFWERSMHGYNPRNVGMFGQLPNSASELVAYLSSLSTFCCERDGRYYDFVPVPLREYFSRPHIEAACYTPAGYRQQTIVPAASDLAWLRSYKHCDLTFRGTIEYRSCCAQPARDALCVAAFHLGLAQVPDELLELLQADRALFNRGLTPVALRRALVMYPWPDFLEKNGLRILLLAVLELAAGALAARGHGEERFLEPLFERAERLTNPALELLALQEAGHPEEELIERWGEL
jgi:gamma-glutamylcysteine synthetase